MLWLTWQIWILLALAFAGGVITGWVAHGQSDEPPAPRPTPAPASANSTDGPAADSEPRETAAPAKGGDAPQSAVASEDGDDLTQIKGIGPKAAEKLVEAGVTRIVQIAAWSEADIDRFDDLVGGRGRIRRDDWVGQAKAFGRR